MDAVDPLRALLADAWPLFGLEVRSERLLLRVPTDAELLDLMALARAGIHGEDEMPFAQPWSIQSSPDFERGYMAYHWASRSGWTAEAWELGLGVWTGDGEPRGMQSVGARGFATYRTIHTGSWLGRPHQGHGYGREMRAAVLGFAFDGLGARAAETEAFADNAASNAVSRGLGYVENGIGELAPQGEPRIIQRFRMTEAVWHSRPRPSLTIVGLDACRELFGA
jgi:RimJ/RimL family protein N-acetyltransferase